MNAAQKIEKYVVKRGFILNEKGKIKQKASDISTAAKQKDLLITIASALGYIS